MTVVDTAASHANGTTTSSYDADGRLVQVVSPDGKSVSYDYDPATGRKTRTSTGPSAAPTTDIRYTYDPNGRLHSVTAVKLNGTTTSQITTYAYDLGDHLVATFLPNGTAEYRVYDDLGRLAAIEAVGSGAVIAGFTYTLDAAGRRTSVSEDASREVESLAFDAHGRVMLNLRPNSNYSYVDSYHYDGDGRLISQVRSIFGNPAGSTPDTTTYTYDLAGNRVRVDVAGANGPISFTYDQRDRLVREQDFSGGQYVDTSYTYDDAGNTTTVTAGSRVTTYRWDIEGRMVAADVPDAAGVIRHTDYAYDDGGIRVSSETDGQETTYLNDSNQAHDQVLEEYAEGGILAATYVRGLDLLFQDRDGVRSFYAKDGLGSVRALTDSSGNVTDTSTFDAYGNRTSWSGSTVNTYQFAGEWRDRATGLDYLRARYYDAAAGRFMSRDSFDGSTSDPITTNHYAYANDDPSNRVDPSGHMSLPSTITVSGISAAFNSFSFSVIQFTAAHPVLSFITVTAISATGVFEGIPPGDPSFLDELATWGRLLRGGFRKIRGSTTPYNLLLNGKGLLSEIDPDGIVEFVVEATGTGMRGSTMFYQMIEHYGSNIKGIRGAWFNKSNTPDNLNLGVVNNLTAIGIQLEDAIKQG